MYLGNGWGYEKIWPQVRDIKKIYDVQHRDAIGRVKSVVPFEGREKMTTTVFATQTQGLRLTPLRGLSYSVSKDNH